MLTILAAWCSILGRSSCQ